MVLYRQEFESLLLRHKASRPGVFSGTARLFFPSLERRLPSGHQVLPDLLQFIPLLPVPHHCSIAPMAAWEAVRAASAALPFSTRLPASVP